MDVTLYEIKSIIIVTPHEELYLYVLLCKPSAHMSIGYPNNDINKGRLTIDIFYKYSLAFKTFRSLTIYMKH